MSLDRREFKRQLKQCRQECEKQRFEALAKDQLANEFSFFWGKIKALDRKKVAMTIELDGQGCQKEIRNHWANLYEQQLYLSPETIQKESDKLNNLIGRNTDTCSFDFADMVKALTKLSLKKSTGLDGIRAEHF